jgi:hypothetical protein
MGIDRTMQASKDREVVRPVPAEGTELTTGDLLRRKFKGSPQRAAVYAGVRPVPPPARLVPRT